MHQSDNEDIKTTEVRMKHYDNGCSPSQALQDQTLVAKEASYIQCCGYIPTDQLSQREWDAMENQDKRGRVYDDDGYYTYRACDVYAGEGRHPRA